MSSREIVTKLWDVQKLQNKSEAENLAGKYCWSHHFLAVGNLEETHSQAVLSPPSTWVKWEVTSEGLRVLCANWCSGATQTEQHSLQCSCWSTLPVWHFCLLQVFYLWRTIFCSSNTVWCCAYGSRRRKTTMHSMFVNMDVSYLNWDSTPKIKILEAVPLENLSGHINSYSRWKDTLLKCNAFFCSLTSPKNLL